MAGGVMDAVLEVSEDGGELLALDGSLRPAAVGAALALIADHNDDGGRGGDVAARLLAADGLLAPGGVRLRDPATGSVIPPSCCFGLESWREWAALAEREEPAWLGHGPVPVLEFDGDLVRVSDGRASVVLEVGKVPDLLYDVQSQLIGFLARVEEWGGPELARVLDAEFHVTRA
ncbi:hypothetical protein [Streptomyces antimicrobicus]|uniref:SMI1/KNR4 family protein n=1 Tax=Streptomyces antimicrobicus TaxID=2883108 RepID=A0ABS8B9K8_9ACTN|nr:hypothetical protein [Streptomyces antimicrobicus]MCB5181310.1 hypothetical protein [Streptomyces antimicrobicus]